MKYKKPALKSITAFTSVKYEDKTKFIEWFARKRRASCLYLFKSKIVMVFAQHKEHFGGLFQKFR